MDGSRIGAQCLPRHRADEVLAFLRKIDRETPVRLDLHLVIDNYATHKTEKVKRWLARQERFKLHFTPTSSSWVNLVERLFAEITRQRIRRGVFHNVTELEDAIREGIEHRNIGRSATVSARALNVDGGFDTLTVIVVATGPQMQ